MQQPTGVGAPQKDPSQEADELHAAENYAAPVAAQIPQLVAPQRATGNPPQQRIYVNGALQMMGPEGSMGGLENQFQAMGFKQDESIGTDQLTMSGGNSETHVVDDTENEGDEPEEDPVKLFVGQVSGHVLCPTK